MSSLIPLHLTKLRRISLPSHHLQVKRKENRILLEKSQSSILNDKAINNLVKSTSPYLGNT